MATTKPALLDTNVLVYAADETSPYHEASATLRDKGLAGDIPLCVCPQVMVEFFAVITDSRRVSRPRSQKEALEEIKKYFRSRRISKIPGGPDAFEKTLDLIGRYKIRRQEVFDAQLVATMIANGVSRLYTFNREDFSRFDEIEVMTP